MNTEKIMKDFSPHLSSQSLIFMLINLFSHPFHISLSTVSFAFLLSPYLSSFLPSLPLPHLLSPSHLPYLLLHPPPQVPLTFLYLSHRHMRAILSLRHPFISSMGASLMGILIVCVPLPPHPCVGGGEGAAVWRWRGLLGYG